MSVLVLALIAVLPARDWGQSLNNDARSKILALENAWNQAEAKGDIAALDMIFDGRMVYIDESGALLNKGQFLIQAAKEAGVHLQWIATETISVHVYGETAVVVGRYRARGTNRGKAFEREGRFIDTWVLKHGNWVCVVAQATPVLGAGS